MYLFIHSFMYLFIYSFIYLFIYVFIYFISFFPLYLLSFYLNSIFLNFILTCWSDECCVLQGHSLLRCLGVITLIWYHRNSFLPICCPHFPLIFPWHFYWFLIVIYYQFFVDIVLILIMAHKSLELIICILSTSKLLFLLLSWQQ